MDEVKTLLERGVEEVIVKEHLEGLLRSDKKLRIKFGIDPTAPDLHLGHTVPLRKLRQFQDAGHTAVLIIGDFTAMIGDPSGREGARAPLTKQQVKANLKKYLKQAGKILDIKKTEVHYNSAWFGKKADLLVELSAKESVQRLLERDDFQKRLKNGDQVMLAEIFYPLMQGYDSVMVKADVEIGGTDQKFNLLMGRTMQRAYNVREQDILTLPLLVGLDGTKKMGKSAGNYIGLDDAPNDMFGKIMRVPDEHINTYHTLLTDTDRTIDDPREAKLELGRIIVGMYHGEKAGEKAREEFINVFSKKEKPSEIPMKKVSNLTILSMLVETGVVASKSEARRLIEQGGVRVNDTIVSDQFMNVPNGAEVQVGKRNFFKVTH